AKLAKKIECGAQFIIPQVGYDMRKMDEILQWLNYKNLKVPVLANIYILPYSVSKFMNANNVPGCVVTDKMVADLAAEAAAPDKGKAARLLRAAKHYAIAKGMGCAGAHLAGHNISYQMVEYIIDKGEELSKGWKGLVEEFDYPQKEGFYFFEKNAATGLNSDTLSVRPSRRRIPLIYRISRLAHSIMFNEKSLFFRMFQPTAARIDSKPRAKRNFGWLEHQAKTAMFGCMNCGDCGLFDVAYICPMSQCPKQQRNGPCGGSYEGWCEVYPGERECIWVQAYNRLKRFGEEGKIEQNIVPPCNWALTETSSWLNFYLGRDHTAKKLGIAPPKKRGKKAEVPAGQA
ncbi:MAG: methylenetetrahydrofolate reductase, partial [Spirochaetales bacterium]